MHASTRTKGTPSMNEPDTAAPDLPDTGLQHQNSTGKRTIGRPFKKGQSGNSSGRRKGSVSLTARLKSALTLEDASKIVAKLISLAKSGDLGATKLLLDRVDGPLNGPLAIAAANTAGGIVTVFSPVDPDAVTGGPIIIEWPHTCLPATPQPADI
jgi:Family of unknown function (DUF5681)